jgi:TPR repeat protein
MNVDAMISIEQRTAALRSAAIAFALGAMLAAFGEARADFTDGMNAFKAGDYEAARSEFEQLAADDDHRGMFALGMLYLRGAGVDRDEDAAERYFEQAAARGHRSAPRRLGAMHEGADTIEAYKWYTVGIAVSCPASPTKRAALTRKMSDDEIAQASARAEEWLSAHADVVDGEFQANFQQELERLQKTIAQ